MENEGSVLLVGVELIDPLRTSREEAPEEMVFLLRDAASNDLRMVGSRAGRSKDHPKKGRGTSDGLVFGPAGWTGKAASRLRCRAGLESQGFSLGRERLDGKRRLSW
jgi:hypothetical protein